MPFSTTKTPDQQKSRGSESWISWIKYHRHHQMDHSRRWPTQKAACGKDRAHGVVAVTDSPSTRLTVTTGIISATSAKNPGTRYNLSGIFTAFLLKTPLKNLGSNTSSKIRNPPKKKKRIQHQSHGNRGSLNHHRPCGLKKPRNSYSRHTNICCPATGSLTGTI